MPGTIFSCKLAAVDSWVRVFIHLLRENREKGMDTYLLHLLGQVHKCSSGGWCRAEIVRCEDMVRVVDWGIEQWISNVRLFRQLPDQCLVVPVQAVSLHLPLVA